MERRTWRSQSVPPLTTIYTRRAEDGRAGEKDERATMEEEDRIPRIIYLQWADRVSPEGATWCVDKINDDDVEYRLNSQSNKWDDVIRALSRTYEKWAAGDDVNTSFTNLMEYYDIWLD